MNRADIEDVIKSAITDTAPDADLANLAGDADMRDELDLDSMDYLNIIIAIEKQTGVSISVADYKQVLTMDGMVSYIESRAK